MSDLAPNEKRMSAGEVYAEGNQVIWQLPNNTYMRMTPEQAIQVASMIIEAAGETNGNV